jgi:8-oxo-dGTP pyrophosphatase MutT (NUDIX family)
VSPLSLDRIERALRNCRGTPADRVEGRPAAVLIPFCMVDGAAHMLLIRRSMEVPFHKGEMAFPGGGEEASDTDLLATAVRETVEELGVSAADIEPWGRLGTIATTSGYALTAYTGRLAGRDGLRPDPREVAEVVPVPLAPLCEGALDRDETRVADGVCETRPTYAYNGRVIWGATGRLIARLVECLKEIQAPVSAAGIASPRGRGPERV